VAEGVAGGQNSAAEQVAADNVRLEVQLQLRIGLTVRLQELVEAPILVPIDGVILPLLLLLPDDNLRSELLRILDAVGCLGAGGAGGEQGVGTVAIGAAVGQRARSSCPCPCSTHSDAHPHPH